DEPTTGLDPQSGRQLWDIIRGLRDRGRTVLLTTHYLEEAERLCDRVAVVDHGRLIALGTPAELVAGLGGAHVLHFALDGGPGGPDAPGLASRPPVQWAPAGGGPVSPAGPEAALTLPAPPGWGRRRGHAHAHRRGPDADQ